MEYESWLHLSYYPHLVALSKMMVEHLRDQVHCLKTTDGIFMLITRRLFCSNYNFLIRYNASQRCGNETTGRGSMDARRSSNGPSLLSFSRRVNLQSRACLCDRLA